MIKFVENEEKNLQDTVVREGEESGRNYVVKRVIMDVAARDEKHAEEMNFCGGAGNMDLYHAIADALESCGYELAGDMVETTEDLSELYREQDYYDFFGIKNYVVKRLEMDVAARDEEHAKNLSSGGGAGDQKVWQSLDKAFEKCGYEMAGDQTNVEDDFTDVYQSNDYEFFTENANEEGVVESQFKVGDRVSETGNKDKFAKDRIPGKWKITKIDGNKVYADPDDDEAKAHAKKNPTTKDNAYFDTDASELSIVKEADEDDYPYTTTTGKKFRKTNQSGLDGEVEITIPSFTVKYKVKEGLQFKDPDGLNSNDDAELHLVTDEQDRIDKLIKDAAMAEMEKRGFSAYSGHSALVGIPATIKFSKIAKESVVKEDFDAHPATTLYNKILSKLDTLINMYHEDAITSDELMNYLNQINEVLDINIEESVVNEGNPVSSKLPEAIDSFLQDIAQIHGTISYGDIMDHDYTDEDIKKLRSLRRKWRTEAQYEEDPDAQKACQDVAEKVAKILKSTVTEDYDMANPKDAEDIDLELRASLSVKTYEAVEALQMPRFRMKLRELVGGFGAELHNCSVDETNPIDMED